MYGYNPQLSVYDKQILEEKNKLAELERQKLQAQYTQPTILNQTIQAGPQHSGIKYAESVDDVNREMVFTDTLFVNKDFTNMWYKNPQGKIRPFLLEEIIPKDEKDIKIALLEEEIKKLKEEKNEQSNDTPTVESTISSTIQTTRNDEE